MSFAAHASPARLQFVTTKVWADPAYQAYKALHIIFTVAPILAGLDKFFHVMVDWDKYLAPAIPNLLQISPHSVMMLVGLVEIVAGVGVALAPWIFGYVVGFWLLGIVANFLLMGDYLDIALRDLGLAVSALSLGRLSQMYRSGGTA